METMKQQQVFRHSINLSQLVFSISRFAIFQPANFSYYIKLNSTNKNTTVIILILIIVEVTNAVHQ